jgi:hypothetical protein
MRGAPAKQRRDDLYWVRHPAGEEWVAVSWRDGEVTLSASYASRRFARNIADAMDLALRLAGSLRAEAVEGVGDRVLDEATVDALTDVDGDYLKLQIGTWRTTMARLAESEHAPLEYPVGPLDVVPEYFALEVATERPVAARRSADDVWRVRPAWGEARFAELGPATLAAADAIHARGGGTIRFGGSVLDASLRDELEDQLGGFGVELYLWANARLASARP